MLKKNFFTMIIIIVGLVILGVFSACGGGDTGGGGAPDGNYNPYDPYDPYNPNPGGNGGNIGDGNYDGGGDPDKNPANKSIIVTNTDEWEAALKTIRNGGNGTATNPKTYTITVDGTFFVRGAGNNSYGPINSFYPVTYITVKLNGNGKLFLIGNGCLLSISDYQTVYIDSADLILEGLTTGQNNSANDNYYPVINVAGGVLELWNGTIRGNTVQGGHFGRGAGVYIGSNQTFGGFTMKGGTISDNITYSKAADVYGGGVYIDTGCTFTMSGGIITENRIIIDNEANGIDYYGKGCGVFNNGTFTMSGGIISNNSGSSTGGYRFYIYGGGVYNAGTFIMSGGTINNNVANANARGIASALGGGVYSSVDFIMSGGSIYNNTATANITYGVSGGGVYVRGIVRIANGEIYNNNATTYASLSGSAEYGTFAGTTWVKNGELKNTNDNIRVVNGVLY